MRQRQPAILLLCCLSPLVMAQESDVPVPATPEACHSLAADATRLACYDAVFGRKAAATDQADQAAENARLARREERQVESAAPATSTARVREFFDLDMPATDAEANAGKGSLLDSRWELAKDSKLGLYQVRAYKPVYLLPAFWTSDKNLTPASPNPNNVLSTPQLLDSTELKLQLSFKTKVAENLFGDNGDIWAGYTQSSRWQAYNSDDSRPFRETNYEPEVILAFRNNYSVFGWKGRMAAVHFNHQSNGRSDPLSRSWNRVILNVGLDRENWALTLRPWWRIKEDAADDNNRDIEDFMGRGDATLTWHKGGHELSLMARHSLRSGERAHGALQVDYGFPINRLLRGHVQVFDGYGESLIDYNHKATYVGVGVSLLEWF
jgi:phospholipase A1